MKKKIMHILTSSEYSGAENVAIQIINGLKNKYDFCYVSRKGGIQQVLEKNNIEFFPIKNMSIRQVDIAIKKFKPDIIHAHDFRASIICALTLLKIPIISHLHNNSPWMKTFHPYSFAYLISCIRYYKILTVSKSVLDEYVFGKFIKYKNLIISNPVNIQNIRKMVNDDNIITYDIILLGRLTLQKNPLRFIDIISKLSMKMPNLRVAIVGNGELEESCNSLIISNKLDKVVDMLGFLENPYNILAKSRILCLTSSWEGYGLVAVEAAALGIPVIASKVGGLIDLVNDSWGKLCISDQEFIHEFELMLTDKNYYDNKHIGAFNRAEQLTNFDMYINSIDEIYLD